MTPSKILLPLAVAAVTALGLHQPAAAASKPGAAFERLAGCWRIEGQVNGQAVRHLARGDWRLDRNYFVYQEQSAPGEPAYAAAAFFGRRDDGKLVVHWLDTFGGQFSQTTGFGEEGPDRIAVDIAYPTGPMRNVITTEPGGWRMRITETPTGKPEHVFADYHFTPAPCEAVRFEF